MPLILISLQHLQAWIYANLQFDTILQKEKWTIHHPFPHNGLMLYKKQLVHSFLDSCMPSWLRLCSWWGIQAACEKYRGGVWLPTYFGSRKYCIRPQNPAVWCISLKVLHLGCCEQAYNNCGMRLRLLFSLWLSIISLFANRINKLSNTINKMSHLHMQKRTLHYAISVQKLSMTSMTQVTIQQTTRCLSRRCGWATYLKCSKGTNYDDEIWSTSIEADLFNSKNKQIVTDHLMYTIFKMLFSTHMKTGIIRKVLFWWPFSSDYYLWTELQSRGEKICFAIK